MPDWSIIIGALWLGVLTSVSPCPLACNIASIAFLARREEKKKLFWSASAYILGRMTAYTVLAAVITAGLLTAPSVSSFFRDYFEGLLGPGLLIVGLFVTGLIKFNIPGTGKLNEVGIKLAERGFAGEFLMGAVFALAFCPVSAALFFGALLPSVIQTNATILLPVSYGIGTALPVVIAVGIISSGLSAASKRLQTMQHIGAKLQTCTGVIILVVGAWITIRDLLI